MNYHWGFFAFIVFSVRVQAQVYSEKITGSLASLISPVATVFCKDKEATRRYFPPINLQVKAGNTLADPLP